MAVKRIELSKLLGVERKGRANVLSTEFLELVFESSYDGIYITDGQANTVMINKRYEIISGLKRQDVLGKNMHDLVKKQVISQSGTLAALEQRKPVTLEQIFRTGKHAIITSTPIFDKEDQPVMVVTNVRDVTELYSLKEQLEKSNEFNRLYMSEVESLRRQVVTGQIVAQAPAMQEVLRMVDKVAGLDATVLLVGESGSGKRQLAQYIVNKSRRKKERFVEVNCSAYAPGTLEIELFGAAPGKGSKGGKRGMLELANGGTIFLSEVSELPTEVQTRLVRFMQTHQMERVGSMEPLQADVRILAGSDRELKPLVDQRLFREDLYYRLNVFPIQVLPLRERREDIPLLIQEMCTQLNKKYRQKKKFSKAALQAMYEYEWPGNLRELRNAVERAMILCSDSSIGMEYLPLPGRLGLEPAGALGEGHGEGVNLRRLVEELELSYIREAYQAHGNVRDAARSLSMDPSTFVRTRKRLEEKGVLQK